MSKKARPRAVWKTETWQTSPEIICPRCGRLNLSDLATCSNCSEPLPIAPVVRAQIIAAGHGPSDLPALTWALACLFLALWGLVIAGPLRPLLPYLAHTYTLIGAGVVSLILTGMFLAERSSGERPTQALISTRDLMVLAWSASALLCVGRVVPYAIPKQPKISHFEMLPKEGDGCRVEVFVDGEVEDELWRLTGTDSNGQPAVVGVVVRRTGGGSVSLPMTMQTTAGDCSIARYHLIAHGKEIDRLNISGN